MNKVPATKRRAQRGAALLDKLRPGWFKRVKITKLKMDKGYIDKGCGCVCAQEFGSYSRGYKELMEASENYVNPEDLGFVAKSYQHVTEEYAALTRDWQNEIRKRRAA